MQYIVYKITNTLNGRYYIGMHQTQHLNDGYMGSGKLLKQAIKKYGLSSFTKEILFVFNNEQEMQNKEQELVIITENSYNLCDGGKGGFGYLNRTGLNIKGVTKRNYKEIGIKSGLTKKSKNYVISEETKKKISDANKLTNKSRGQKNSIALTGKYKSEEHKRKISESLKNRAKILHAGLM